MCREWCIQNTLHHTKHEGNNKETTSLTYLSGSILIRRSSTLATNEQTKRHIIYQTTNKQPSDQTNTLATATTPNNIHKNNIVSNADTSNNINNPDNRNDKANDVNKINVLLIHTGYWCPNSKRSALGWVVGWANPWPPNFCETFHQIIKEITHLAVPWSPSTRTVSNTTPWPAESRCDSTIMILHNLT